MKRKKTGKKFTSVFLAGIAAVLSLTACAAKQPGSEAAAVHLIRTTPITAQERIVSADVVYDETISMPSQVVVPILMFHDVRVREGGAWAISAEHFRSTLIFLQEKGYTPIFFEQLIDFVDGVAGIPENPVCITLDDGYFSNYRNVLPIVTELEVPITVFMTCNTVRPEGEIPGLDETVICKMSNAELKIMEASPYVQIQSHTYGLHGENTTYSDGVRDNAMPVKKEKKQAFKEMFDTDCLRAEEILEQAGVEEHLVFSYPSGKYHKWSEEVLRERNYRASVTTEFHHTNLVVRGEPDSLFLLGRMNVNDATPREELLEYLERKPESGGKKKNAKYGAAKVVLESIISDIGDKLENFPEWFDFC